MTVDEVMKAFRKLPREEQRKVYDFLQAKFAGEPSREQMAEFEKRAERLRRNPENGIPWEQVRAELKDRLEARRACPAK